MPLANPLAESSASGIWICEAQVAQATLLLEIAGCGDLMAEDPRQVVVAVLWADSPHIFVASLPAGATW